MSVPNPFTNPLAWSKFFFFGNGKTVSLPGRVTAVDGHDVTEMWLVQKAQNSSYAVTIWRGRLLNESIKIDLTLANAEDYTAYEAAVAQLQPKPPSAGGFGNQPTWNVVNAALNFAGIIQVGVRSMGTPRTEPNLFRKVTIDLIQYRKFIVSKVGPPDPPKKQTENDRLAAELDQQIKKAKTL